MAGGTAPNGADALILAFFHQGRRDLSLAVQAWFLVAKLVAPLWIPAFAGMMGGARGKVAKSIQSALNSPNMPYKPLAGDG